MRMERDENFLSGHCDNIEDVDFSFLLSPEKYYELEFYRENTEVNSMNEYDRLHRQAQRYKELYPKGTRILLLHMGDDPRPVEDDMRGTVMFVDDTSTVHCKFDNGRQLGIIPGEDSFRKLTDEELAEEQADSEDMDEDSGPVMGM